MSGVEISVLGQAGVRLRGEDTIVLVDPWTAPHPERLVPPADTTPLATGVDRVLITHEHSDHLDTAFLSRLSECSPSARDAVPELAAPLLDGVVPPGRVDPLAAGDRIEQGALRIDAVVAFHALTAADPISSERFLGYVIALDGVTAYHAGDTLVSAELVHQLEGRGIDIAFVPINGRDARRENAGIVGNCSASEAVELCTRVGVETLVPIRWDAVAGNTGRPADVMDALAELGRRSLTVLVPAHLTPFRFG